MKRVNVTLTLKAQQVIKRIREKNENFNYSKEVSDFTEKQLKKKYKVK